MRKKRKEAAELQQWIALKKEIGKQFYRNLFTLMSRDLLLLLLSLAKLEAMSSDSSTHNVVVSSIFIFISWVYLATCGYEYTK